MANLVRGRAWGTVKPPVGSRIDWGHPLAQGLVFAATLPLEGAAAFDHVTGAVASPTGTPTWDPRGGGGRNYHQAADDAAHGDEWVGQEGPYRQISSAGMTLLATVTQTGTSGDFDGLIGFATADGATWLVGIQCSSAGTPEIWVNNTEKKALSSTVAASDVPYTFVSRHNAVEQVLSRYIGGSASPDQISGGSPEPFATPSWAATNKIVLGNARTAVRNWKGVVHKGYAWARMLTDDEIAWLQSEPYTFLVPPAPKVFYLGFDRPPPAGQTATLTPAQITVTPTALTASPGTVSQALTPATITTTPVALTASPQAPSVALTPATIALTPIALTASPGDVSAALTTAEIVLTAVAFTGSPEAVELALSPALIQLVAVTLVLVDLGTGDPGCIHLTLSDLGAITLTLSDVGSISLTVEDCP